MSAGDAWQDRRCERTQAAYSIFTLSWPSLRYVLQIKTTPFYSIADKFMQICTSILETDCLVRTQHSCLLAEILNP